jgi:maleate isomerase
MLLAFRMLHGLPAAVRLLAGARMDLLAFHCAAVTTYSQSLDDTIGRRCGPNREPGDHTAEAPVAALRALSADRLVLLTLCFPGLHRREIQFLTSHGSHRGRRRGAGHRHERRNGGSDPGGTSQLRAAAPSSGRGRLFLTCTAPRSAEIIEPLEREIGRLVVTSDHAMARFPLRRGGSPTRWPVSAPCSPGRARPSRTTGGQPRGDLAGSSQPSHRE